MKLLIQLTLLLLIAENSMQAQSQPPISLSDSTQTYILDKPYQKPSGLESKIEYKSQLPDLLSPLKNNYVKGEHTNPFVDKVQVKGTDNSMPCYQPKGSFPMLICQPDTTIRYSLLIKKE